MGSFFTVLFNGMTVECHGKRAIVTSEQRGPWRHTNGSRLSLVPVDNGANEASHQFQIKKKKKKKGNIFYPNSYYSGGFSCRSHDPPSPPPLSPALFSGPSHAPFCSLEINWQRMGSTSVARSGAVSVPYKLLKTTFSFRSSLLSFEQILLGNWRLSNTKNVQRHSKIRQKSKNEWKNSRKFRNIAEISDYQTINFHR